MEIKLRTFVFVLVLFLVVLFAAVNWPLFIEPASINLIFATVLAPLGIIMLATVAGLTALYLVLLAMARTDALLGSRRASREVEDANKLALSAEESRFGELRADIQDRLTRIEDKLEEVRRQRAAEPVRETVVRDRDGIIDHRARTDREIEEV